ncbi:peptidyl-prolyl cis-trans isomerase, putative [Plasmodium ovale]|uniref:Peptidyl-prolyl cis-trans isomerase, putative n=2 Tax=Plasmodium ovale TaxID=36330 RepID=A0A1D3KYW7_PLAOA|nr:peptidyl-prolyl cis-trans isomerase, putative (CYP81) [Plasmodium ovale curtisi]SBS80544.1 peptidyl-prolyl cis-trans isomerase, putative (CYP81) [Plasmodium ovale curtisi]SCD22429.1 peptidyl-prolyl cis-trans isomerase, putative [Plasmodium ovale]
MGKKRYVYLEFSVNTVILGKVYFELFNDDEIKKSVDNFTSICKGNQYHSIYSGDVLTYKNCLVEKVKKDKCIKCGNLTKKIKSNFDDKKNCKNYKLEKSTKYEKVECIYGKFYESYCSKRRHINAGLLTIVQIGKKKYSSVFKITLNKVHTYNNKHIIIGRVIKNMHILRAIEMIPVYNDFQPKLNVFISDCNEVNETFFKGGKVSHRQAYIDSLFAHLGDNTNPYNVRDGGDVGVDGDSDDGDSDAHTQNEEDTLLGNFHIGGKKKKKKITEKQRGIELLNRILADLDSISKGSNSIEKVDQTNLQNHRETFPLIREENIEHKTEDTVQQMDIPPSDTNILTYEDTLNKGMTPREKKLMNVHLKINQSKSLNELEVKKERMTGISWNCENSKLSEFKNYQFEYNLSVRNAIPKRKKDVVDSNQKEGEKNLSHEEEPREEAPREEAPREEAPREEAPREEEPHEEEPHEEAKRLARVYNTSAIKVSNERKKKRKGLGMYELDTDINLYRKIKFNFSINRKIYDEQKTQYSDNFYGRNLLLSDYKKCTQKEKDKVVEFCKKQEELRSKLSRKRKEENGIFKNYINRRNKIYNKKLDRYFNQHTAEIRQNLERPC